MELGNSLGARWSNLLNIGVDDQLSPFEIRKVRLINGILLTGEALFILLIIKSVIMRVPEEWSVQLVGALLLPIPVLLNKYKKYALAKLLCMLIPFIYLSSLTLYWGSARGSQLIILACMGLAILFFDRKLKAYVLIAIGGLCIISVEVYNFDRIPFYVTEQLKLAYIINIVITIILMTVIATIFKRESDKHQISILKKNAQITEQHSQLLNLNKDLRDSIKIINEQTKYAQAIQQSILPVKEEIRKVLPEHFIFFKPRDLVSGDFYFFTKVKEKVFIAAVDCTGHGVPGAFMSMIGYNLLLEAIELNHIFEPAKVLDYLQERIIYSLRQQHNENRDGMDISICMIDKANDTLEYAGAKHPLILVKNGEFRKVEADRVSIGGILRREDHKFKNHEFKLSDVSGFYIYTDGFPDQHGGNYFKRYMSHRLRELLMENYGKKVVEQKEILENTFTDWCRGREQTDDILIIGVKL